MSSCGFVGNSDMYGLGIRIGFYLQWYGTILANWLAPEEVPGMRFSNTLFVSATFLALIIQTANDSLKPVEIYIILLLTFGGYLYFVPLYLWRLIIWGYPQLDPSRYPRVLAGPVYSVLNFALLVSVSAFQLWFWFAKVNDAGSDGCEEFGFFFEQVDLKSKRFVVGNILLHGVLLLCCLVVMLMALRIIGTIGDGEVRISKFRQNVLQELQTTVNLIVASVVTVGTELTILWNGIEGVGNINSAGQTIPLVIGVGLVVRVFYIWIFGDVDGGRREKYSKMSSMNSSHGANHLAVPFHTLPTSAAPIHAFPPQSMPAPVHAFPPARPPNIQASGRASHRGNVRPGPAWDMPQMYGSPGV